MSPFSRFLSAIFASALLAASLVACSSGNAESSPASSASSAEQAGEHDVTREEAESILTAAGEASWGTVTFEIEAESTATAVNNGETQQDSATTSMKGELDKTGEAPKMHFAYESSSGVGIDKRTYDMYLDADTLIVNQKGQIFVNEMTAETLQGYVNTALAVQAGKDIAKVLDSASSIKVSEQDGETTVSVTSDTAKLAGTDLVDMSSLPEGSSLATMVTSYTIGADGHFKTIRAMVSTTGAPTFHITQTYRYTAYDSTQLPEWPDLSIYETAYPDVFTDESGRQYIVGDDGTIYYIDSIGEDGTVYYSMPAAGGDEEDLSWLDDEDIVFDLFDLIDWENMFGNSAPAEEPTVTAPPEETVETEMKDFIDVNGKRYFLDEPGSSIEDVGNGYYAFYPADGTGPYFIQY